MLRTILVDDEALSIKRLKKILAECSEIQVCSTFSNSLEAHRALLRKLFE